MTKIIHRMQFLKNDWVLDTILETVSPSCQQWQTITHPKLKCSMSDRAHSDRMHLNWSKSLPNRVQVIDHSEWPVTWNDKKVKVGWLHFETKWNKTHLVFKWNQRSLSADGTFCMLERPKILAATVSYIVFALLPCWLWAMYLWIIKDAFLYSWEFFGCVCCCVFVLHKWSEG
jgi:hypothetical protein